LLRLQFEVNVSGDRDVKGSELVWLIGRGHNNVAIGVAVQLELLCVEAPRHELQIFILKIVFSWLGLGWVYIETNHGSN
jgi:hypothetical protein